MKKWSKLLSVPVAVALLAACGQEDASQDDAAQDTTEDVTEDTTQDTATEEESTEETSGDESTEEETEETEEEDTADAETGASVISDPSDAQRAMSAEEGKWIVIIEEDMEVEEDLVLEQQSEEQQGEEQGNDGERKLAFYYRDENEEANPYTMTVPSITIEHENVRFAGNVVGDIIVDANGFSFYEDPSIDGDLIFTSAEYEESAEYDESSVSGEVVVEGEEGEEDAEQ